MGGEGRRVDVTGQHRCLPLSNMAYLNEPSRLAPSAAAVVHAEFFSNLMHTVLCSADNLRVASDERALIAFTALQPTSFDNVPATHTLHNAFVVRTDSASGFNTHMIS